MLNEDPSSQSQKKHVLVVDDDLMMLKSTTRALEENGYLVDSAETGEEAIAKSKEHIYDVALVDLRLPDMDGIEILARANLSNAVKIMLTGYPSLVTGVEAMEEGVDAYLRKPVRPGELILLIESKLKSKKRT